MATINIDGKSYPINDGKNLLEEILSLGFDLPYFCWHPALGSVGSCRQCAIKKYSGENDTEGRLVMACMEPALDGLRLSVKDQEAVDFREMVIEWLMLNHPHDCPICDEGGECHLQDMTVMAGHAYRRTRFKKRTYHNQDLGPCINHEMNRCIQCYRCVRFYNDYAGADDLQVFSAHDHVYFGRHEDGTLESEFSGNLVEVCPTGVFTDKTLKDHYTRKWDLTSAPSVCQHCSLGCNILAGERYGSLRRILSRYNPQVNGYFICDRGRFGYDFVNGNDRISHSIAPNHAENILDSVQVVEQLRPILTKGSIMGIGSPRASLESNFLLRTLVGEDHFYNGIAGSENQMLQLAINFLKEGPAKTPSLKEIENCDAVVVIGEDLTNTAPMLDLALNQSVRVRPLEKIDEIGVPSWNDAAAREYLQKEKGPLYILTPHSSKLDRIATKCFRSGLPDLITLVRSIEDEIDGTLVTDSQNSATNLELVREIAQALAEAKNPLIITGSTLGSSELMIAAINLVNSLCQSGKPTGITFVFPECNSLGAGMMGSNAFDKAIASSPQYDSVIVLENDLFRRAPASTVNQFLESFENVVVLDHTASATTLKADLILASGTFAEADGTLVNNEGRAQRFFQVQALEENIKESWRWLMLAGKAIDDPNCITLQLLDDIIDRIEQELPQFVGISRASLPAGYRVNGQKLTRSPHRYSGRTSMFAHLSVNEPRPPEDPDTALSFTMEGYRGVPPNSATSFYWSPGWNSAQAINKFRNEISHGRIELQPGIRLFDPDPNAHFQGLEYHNEADERLRNLWTVVPLHHIFGSEELSIKSAAIAERAPGPFVTINTTQAETMDLKQGDQLTVVIDQQPVELLVHCPPEWPQDHLGLPAGFPGVPYFDSDSVIQLKTPKDEH